MNQFLKAAIAIQQEIINNRRELHQRAELGMDLPKTTAYVMGRLREIGLEPVEICQSGISCLIGKGGKTILLRADMDALPIKENTGLPFACGDGTMHACGHECHTAMLLGAAKLLKACEDELNGTVKLMFQPGEETLEGAKAMIEAGIMENPKVDAAFTLHVGVVHPDTVTGTISYVTGRMGSHASELWVTLRAPEHSRANLIDVASHMILSLQELAANEVKMSEPNIEIFNSFECDNERPDGLPKTVTFKGVVISLADDVQQQIDKRVNQIIDHIATAYNVERKVYYAKRMIPMEGDAEFAAQIHPYLEQVTGPGRTRYLENSWLKGGVDDFAAISRMVPSQYVSLGAGCTEEGYTSMGHKDTFLINEETLHVGAAAYANVAYSWLRDTQ